MKLHEERQRKAVMKLHEERQRKAVKGSERQCKIQGTAAKGSETTAHGERQCNTQGTAAEPLTAAQSLSLQRKALKHVLASAPEGAFRWPAHRRCGDNKQRECTVLRPYGVPSGLAPTPDRRGDAILPGDGEGGHDYTGRRSVRSGSSQPARGAVCSSPVRAVQKGQWEVSGKSRKDIT